ncbi:MAG: hypothetical protein Q4C22_07245, partial [Bacillota bacterium]|nr:hypothetical protein [Bacillota bacterium]
MKRRRAGKYIVIVIAALILLCCGALAVNKSGADYGSLNGYDQRVLAELNAVLAAENADGPLWSGYTLADKTLLLISKDTRTSYLVNAGSAPPFPVGARVSLPSDFVLDSVYRLSPLTPSVWSLMLEGNFNTIGKQYHFWGQDVYFLKYTHEALDAQYSSEHFITFLTHEAFHYYMQNHWETNDGGDLSPQELIDSLTSRDFDLMEQSFASLSDIQAELQRENPDRSFLLQSAQAYIQATEQRIAANPTFMEVELSRETAEGTAQYACIAASRLAGYDYGVMYYDNRQNVPFSEVVPLYREGVGAESFWFQIPYSTGAQLCFLLDALEAPQWQEALNSQTPD